jgi:hypothetical protein
MAAIGLIQWQKKISGTHRLSEKSSSRTNWQEDKYLDGIPLAAIRGQGIRYRERFAFSESSKLVNGSVEEITLFSERQL